MTKLVVAMPPEPDDISDAEKEMREILSDPAKLRKFAAAARAAWEKTPAGILAKRKAPERIKSKRVQHED